MDITEKIAFLEKYSKKTQFIKQVKILLKDEGYFIASELPRRLNIDKRRFSECHHRVCSDFVVFNGRRYFKE